MLVLHNLKYLLLSLISLYFVIYLYYNTALLLMQEAHFTRFCPYWKIVVCRKREGVLYSKQYGIM
jgi:hypothetical protein